MGIKTIAGPLLKRGLACFGVNLVRTTSDKVRGLDLLSDLKCLINHKSDPTIFDVGANDGETVQDFIKIFPHAQIVAFEPFDGCYKKLQTLFKANAKVRIENTALGSERGTSQLNVYSGSNMNSLLQLDERPENVLRDSFTNSGTALVTVETLDAFCSANAYENIDVLKSDTQGYDLNVLRGASGLLERHRIKAILVEVNFVPMYREQPTFLELHGFLSAFGYCLVDMYNHARHDGCTAWCDVCYVASDLAD
jgi:FkbM family methyltransferase